MPEIGNQLVQVIKDKEFKHITGEIVEGAIDVNLKDGLLKEVPLLSTIIGVFNTVNNIKDRLFIKKLLAFLHELKSISEDEIVEQLIKLEDDNKYKTKVGEKLLYIIDKCEDPDKAILTGNLFKTYLEKKIDYDDFLSATSIIERTPLPDLLFFINDDSDDWDMEGGGSTFVAYGLMEIIVTKPKIKISNEEPHYGDKYAPSEEEILEAKMSISEFSIRAHVSWIGSLMRKHLSKK